MKQYDRFKKWLALINYFKKYGLKNPTPFPLAGNFVTALIRGFREYDSELIKKYGKTCGFFELNRPTVVTTDLNFIKAVMIKDFGYFVNRRVKFFVINNYH